MSMKCLLVQGISPTLPQLFLKQTFEQFGPCQIELKREFALIQYQNPETNLKVIQYLHNTDLNGKNQQKIDIRIIDLASLNTIHNNKANTNSNQTNENVRIQNENLLGKNSQEKQFGASYQANSNMNVQKGTNSPFQTNLTQNKNIGLNSTTYQNSTMNIAVQKNTGGYQNIQSTMQTENNMSLKEKENIRQPQFNSFFSGKMLDHDYLKTKPNPSSKVSHLVQYYHSNNNKSNVGNDKVKIYSNHEEFWSDLSKMPRSREQNYNENKPNVLAQRFVDYEKYTIADLTAELKKRGVSISGTKQALKNTLERMNENIY